MEALKCKIHYHTNKHCLYVSHFTANKLIYLFVVVLKSMASTRLLVCLGILLLSSLILGKSVHKKQHIKGECSHKNIEHNIYVSATYRSNIIHCSIFI